MSKKYMYLFGAALLALSGIGATAQSAQAKTTHHARTSVTRNVNQYFVNAPQSIGSNSRVIKGTASKGFKVTLQNGKKVLASTYANKRTGRYTLRIPKGLKANMHLTVMAQKGYWHPYKVVYVKTPANQKAAVKANKKVSNKTAKEAVKKPVKKTVKKSAKKTPKVTKSSINTTVAKLQNQMNDLKIRNAKERKLYNNDEAKLAYIKNQANSKVAAKRASLKAVIAQAEKELNQLDSETGSGIKTTAKNNSKKVARKAPAKKVDKVNRNRKARKSNKANKVTVKTPNGNWKSANQRWNLSQKRGLNESLYHNGKFVKKLVTNAPYNVKSVKNNVWTVNYKSRNQKKSQSMTLQFLTNNHFKVTSQNGKRANLNFLRY